jgi:hypothetical protein
MFAKVLTLLGFVFTHAAVVSHTEREAASKSSEHKPLMRSMHAHKKSQGESFVIEADGINSEESESRVEEVRLIHNGEENAFPSFLETVSEEDLADRVCGLASWNPWTPCSKECGSGRQTRTREAKGLLGSYHIVSEDEASLADVEHLTADLVHQDFQINNDVGDFITVLAAEKESRTKKEHFNVRWRGQILIEKEGRYDFKVKSGGETRLSVGAGLHLESKKSGEDVFGRAWLSKGVHSVDLQMSGKVGHQQIDLSYSGPDTNKVLTEVPSNVLRHWSTNSVCKGLLLEARHCNVQKCF